MPIIKVTTSDSKVIDVDEEIVKLSNHLKTQLQDVRNAGGEEVITMSNVNSEVFVKIIEWLTHHKINPSLPSTSEDEDMGAGHRADELTPYDVQFLDVDPGTLFEYVLAANYLDIKRLLHICCKRVTEMVEGQSPEDIRKAFKIPKDLTVEQEAQIRKENEWCEEK